MTGYHQPDFSTNRTVYAPRLQLDSVTRQLRRLERVFRCCSVCETMEDYKEGYLMGWANYMSPCNSIAGLYFEGTCDVISVTMATHKVHKNVH